MIDQAVLKPLLTSFEWFNYKGIEFFHEWLDLIIYALASEEEKYMGVVNKYLARNQREVIDKYAEMFGDLRTALEKTNADVLGTLYEIEASRSKRGTFGQFFTPENICEMMAKMIMLDNKAESAPFAANDPCCGSGRMLLYAFKASPKGTFFGQDLDPVCTKMCALNFCFFNMDGFVLNGNSLTGEVNFGYRTRSSYLGGDIRLLVPEELEKFRLAKIANIKSEPVVEKEKPVKVKKKTAIIQEIDSPIRSLF